jgi:Protein of unknown function (DUF2442)
VKRGAAPWRVVDVRVIGDYRLAVRFADGTEGTVDASRLVQGDRAGVFEALRDPAVFSRVGLEHGSVVWPGELDLAPDAMYDAIRANGCWVPE